MWKILSFLLFCSSYLSRALTSSWIIMKNGQHALNIMLVRLIYPPFKVRIKRIVIAKCDVFFYYRDAKEILFCYFRDTKHCAKHEKTREFPLYWWDHVCKVNEWSLVDCFHREFRVSTQIMAHHYCIESYFIVKTFYL